MWQIRGLWQMDVHQRRRSARQYSASNVVFATAISLSFSPIAGLDQAPTPSAGGKPAAVTVLKEGLAIANPDRSERTVIQADPIALRVIVGDWAMPKNGDAVT